MEDDFLTSAVDFEDDFLAMFARNTFEVVVNSVDLVAVDFFEDVADFHVGMPCGRLGDHCDHHHSLSVHHRAQACPKVRPLAASVLNCVD